MDQQPTTSLLDRPPSYDGSIDTTHTATPKRDQTQGVRTKTDTNQVNGETYTQRRYTYLPDSMLSTTRPHRLYSFPDQLAHPNALIKKENVIYPAQNLSLSLYYLREPTYLSNDNYHFSETFMYKRHGAIQGNSDKYTTIASRPECYTAFAKCCSIDVKGWKHEWSLLTMHGHASLRATLGFESFQRDSRTALSIKQYGHYGDKAVVIKRSAGPENASEEGWRKTYSWSDSTAHKLLAWESQTTPRCILSHSSAEPSSNTDHRLDFVHEALSKEMRDLLTAAWCISLWIDAEAARRKTEKAKEENKGLFGHLAKLWQHEDGGSKPEPNKLREQLGLDGVTIPEPPRELKWYEAGEKSTVMATLQSVLGLH